ncbi:hypothetical protein DTO280E4_286 [Paecilomyces variotii]|nr:hypothetical protein DTO280E4_286 [Paecilomyces variotii]
MIDRLTEKLRDTMRLGASIGPHSDSENVCFSPMDFCLSLGPPHPSSAGLINYWLCTLFVHTPEFSSWPVARHRATVATTRGTQWF